MIAAILVDKDTEGYLAVRDLPAVAVAGGVYRLIIELLKVIPCDQLQELKLTAIRAEQLRRTMTQEDFERLQKPPKE